MTDNLLVPSDPPAALARVGVAVARLRELRDAADSAAAQTTFSRFQEGCAAQTRRAHRVDLTRFARYLASGGVLEIAPDDGPALDAFARDLLAQPALWELLSPGLVELFRQWLLDHGYAIASTNRALATLKTYAGLAFQAGVLPEAVYQQINLVKTTSRTQGRNIDEARPQTRLRQKDAPIAISRAQARTLKRLDDGTSDTPLRRRDRLLMCLLLDHGLRVGEVADLLVSSINLTDRTLHFYRHKVDKTQTHRLTRDTLAAARAYINNDAQAMGPLVRGSDPHRRGKLGEGMSLRAMQKRVTWLAVKYLGRDYPLSPHDCRHYWATQAARHGTDPFTLQEAGGWSSLAMPRRYIAEAAIANEGLRLGEEEG
jgi:integrase